MAFALHLTRRWSLKYGGDLYFPRTGERVPPSFNSLTIFPTHNGSLHLVTPVATVRPPTSAERRLALHGWWMTNTAARTGPLQSFPPLPAGLVRQVAVFQGHGGARMPHGDADNVAAFGWVW